MLHMSMWLPAVLAMATLFLAAVRKTVPENLLLIAEGDEDIKIADGSFRKRSTEDQAEQAARDFLRQRELGNIDRARELGWAYADSLWEMSEELLAADPGSMTQQEKHHCLLLCSYLINRAIAENSPNSIVAQTALNTFYIAVEERSGLLHRHVSDTAAFSLYILNERTGGGARQVGEIFAKQCGREGDEQKIAEGGDLYAKQLERYKIMAGRAGYRTELL